MPQQEISAATIYLLRASTQRNNVFIEYIYVDGVWEKLGEQNIDLTGYATEEWVREQGYLTEHQDISDKADISYVDERFDSLELPETDLSNLATKTELETKVDKIEGKGLSTEDYTTEEKEKLSDLSNYDDTEIKNLIDEKADKSEIPTKVSQLENDGNGTNSKFATIKEVEDILSQATGGESAGDVLIALNEHKENFNNPHNVTAAQIDAYTKEETNAALKNKADKTELFNKDYNELTNKPVIPNNISQLNNDSGYITKTIEDLTNYYKKSETYTQEEINQKISAIPKFKVEVVNTLPISNISSDTIYLKTISGESPNLYEEYIYVNNQWEKLGTQTVDLTNYALKSELFSKDYNELINKPTIPTNNNQLTNGAGYITNSALTEYAKKSELPIKVSELTNDSGYLTSIPTEYVTETELNELLETKEDKVNLKALAYKDSLNKEDVGLGNVLNVASYSKTEIDTELGQIRKSIDELSGITGDTEIELQNYYTKTQTNELLSLKSNISDLGALAYKNGLTKSDVGLNNVDNTSDLNKPISTATQNALDDKENKANLKALAYKDSLSKTDVGLGNVNNVAITEEQVTQIDTNKSNIEQLQTNLNNSNSEINNIKEKDILQDEEISNVKTQLNTNTNDISTLKENVQTNVNSINELHSKNNTQDTNITNAQNTANEAISIAQGRTRSKVFDTFADMQNYLKNASSSEFKKGDNLYIRALNVPDYWVSNILNDNSGLYGYYEISQLETQKVDLTEYQMKKLTTNININGVEETTIESAIDELNIQKVNKVEGKGLSTNDFTTTEKTKLSNIEEGANKYVLPSDVVKDSNYVHTDNNYTTAEKNKLSNLSNYDDTEIKENIVNLENNKVNKTDLANYQSKLNFDTTPTEGSTNPVTSDGIKKALDLISDNTNIEVTEKTVKLSEDLYTYVSIGKITGASNTNPKLVGNVGDTLKSVFNNVFGTQEDVQPTISTSNTNVSVSSGTRSYGGGEYGTSVSATTVNVTFTLSNYGTSNYGYRVGTTKYRGSQTFYYPVTKQSNADIVITLPSGQTATSSMVKAGTYVSSSGNVLYCNFNSSKQVTIQISLSADTVGESTKTRYGSISASVKLGSAQIENQLTSGTAITSFLTYLGNDATSTSALSGRTETNSTGSYTISSGSKYVYWAKTTSTNTPTTWTRYSTSTSVTDLQLSCNAGEYIWVASTGSYTSFYAWNDASGKYNTDQLPTTKTGTHSIINAQGVSVSGYYFYRTTNSMLQAVNTKFKLV